LWNGPLSTWPLAWPKYTVTSLDNSGCWQGRVGKQNNVGRYLSQNYPLPEKMFSNKIEASAVGRQEDVAMIDNLIF
jgi:hypothetical protein